MLTVPLKAAGSPSGQTQLASEAGEGPYTLSRTLLPIQWDIINHLGDWGEAVRWRILSTCELLHSSGLPGLHCPHGCQPYTVCMQTRRKPLWGLQGAEHRLHVLPHRPLGQHRAVSTLDKARQPRPVPPHGHLLLISMIPLYYAKERKE